jgi:hypothetical protein
LRCWNFEYVIFSGSINVAIQEDEKSVKWKQSHKEEHLVGATRKKYKIYRRRALGN